MTRRSWKTSVPGLTLAFVLACALALGGCVSAPPARTTCAEPACPLWVPVRAPDNAVVGVACDWRAAPGCIWFDYRTLPSGAPTALCVGRVPARNICEAA